MTGAVKMLVGILGMLWCGAMVVQGGLLRQSHEDRELAIDTTKQWVIAQYSGQNSDLYYFNGSNMQCYLIRAGQTIPVGRLCVTLIGTNMDNQYFVIKYEANVKANGDPLFPSGDVQWMMLEAQLGWFPSVEQATSTPGQLPYKNTPKPEVPFTEWTVTTPKLKLLWDPNGLTQCPTFPFPGVDSTVQVIISAHSTWAKYVYSSSGGGYVDSGQRETGWSSGVGFTDSKKWGWWSPIQLYCKDVITPVDPPPPSTQRFCETSFAKSDSSSICFSSITNAGTIVAEGEGDFMRWGWTNGPYSPGSVGSMTVHAGAGQCDVTKASVVGTVDFEYTLANTVKVDLNIPTGKLIDFEELHIYVGTEILPISRLQKGVPVYTVAPGQYSRVLSKYGAGGKLVIYEGMVKPVTTYTFTTTITSGNPIYIVFHQVACRYIPIVD